MLYLPPNAIILLKIIAKGDFVMKRFGFVILTALAFLILSCNVFASDIPTPSGYNANDFQKMVDFLEQTDENGVKNGFKLNSNYSPYNPITWDRYIEWVNIAGISRIKRIGFTYLPKNINIVGNLNLNNFSKLDYINCSSTSISKLDIGYLPNLEYLYVDNTPISSLDLSAVPKLKWLGCSSTSISNLDLSAVPNLESLDYSNTPILNLDLSNVPNLYRLVLNYNKISSLDLSKVPNLASLSCKNTLISELDLSKVPNLVGLDCSNTSISKLDLSKVPNLWNLNCGNTLISELDLSKVPKLEYLDCANMHISNLDLSNVPKLEQLLCYDTQISNLDLGKVPNLEYLYCNNTQISNLDLSKMPNLNSLRCQSCKLGIDELKDIKLNYSHLYDKNFENQNVFDKYTFTKGDISNFGNETSTYKWYVDDVLIDDISTPIYDLSNYKGKKVKCEITDGDITLKSNKTTVIGIEFDNPPESVNKGTVTKLSAILNTFDIEDITDTSISWSIYNTENSSIDANGNLNVAVNETSEYIIVRATSNFNPEWHEEIKILINSNCEDTLKEAVENANRINNKENSSINEVIKAIMDLSKAIQDYENNCVKP